MPNSSSPAPRRARAPVDVVQHPFQLGARKIGIEQQAGALGDHRLMPRVAQRRGTDRRCAGPARRWRCGSARPVARSQTSVVSRWLVMPMAAMSAAAIPAFSITARQVRRGGGPQIGRVMLDPARRREMLRKFLLRRGHQPHRAVKQDRAARGRALIYGQNMGHGLRRPVAVACQRIQRARSGQRQPQAQLGAPPDHIRRRGARIRGSSASAPRPRSASRRNPRPDRPRTWHRPASARLGAIGADQAAGGPGIQERIIRRQLLRSARPPLVTGKSPPGSGTPAVQFAPCCGRALPTCAKAPRPAGDRW